MHLPIECVEARVLCIIFVIVVFEPVHRLCFVPKLTIRREHDFTSIGRLESFPCALYFSLTLLTPTHHSHPLSHIYPPQTLPVQSKISTRILESRIFHHLHLKLDIQGSIQTYTHKSQNPKTIDIMKAHSSVYHSMDFTSSLSDIYSHYTKLINKKEQRFRSKNGIFPIASATLYATS